MRIAYVQPRTINIDVKVFVLVLDKERTSGTLVEVDSGVRWRVRTGPWGNGPLPNGQYAINPAIPIDPADERNEPFMDKSGNAWFARLIPAFDCTRSGLGIHPDGNVPGTEGCVGAIDDDTTDLREALKEPAILMVV